MSNKIKNVVRLFSFFTITFAFFSCGNNSGDSSGSNGRIEGVENIDETNCSIHLENGSVIKINPDKTAQLIEDGATLYGSWGDLRRLGYGINLTFRDQQRGLPMNFYLKDDYLYFDRNDARAKDPNSRRIHFTRSSN